MRVAFVTTYDAADVRHWSGLGFFIKEALLRSGLELSFIGPLSIGPGLMLRLKASGFWHNRIRRRRFFRSHDGGLGRHYSRLVDRQLAAMPEVDVILSPGVVPVSHLEDKRPLAIWSDATHARIFNYYDEYSGLCRANLRDGHRMEHRALSRCAAAMFCSDWAAESAREDYGVPHNRVHTVPFGANIDPAPADDEVRAFIARRPRDRCRLLFAGVDWERKGGPLAVEVATLLNRNGLPTELTIVGCDPFRNGKAPSFVRTEGFLNKNSAEGRARIHEIFGAHHFLIVPSKAECYGLVYCEANAFGMPCLARNTGGVPTIVEHGTNGFLFEPARPAQAYADAIHKLFANFDQYLAMAERSRHRFKDRLNWDVAGRRAAEILAEAISKNPLATV